MRKVFGYILTPFYFFFFGLTLLIFHPLQWLAVTIIGAVAHQKVVNVMNWFLVKCLYFLGTRVAYHAQRKLPQDRPLIVVSNHQSLYDISPLTVMFRKHDIKWVAKKELALKNYPSISFNLKYGGSALIDRKDPRQALSEIKKLGQKIEEENWSVCIFPEGTRSRDGRMKPFSVSGLKTLLKYAPRALVVPITINNSWKTVRFGSFPHSTFESVNLRMHNPIEPAEYSAEELTAMLEEIISSALTS